ncbi:hypothetical protein DFJ73DRAFT_962571 [Zopfochytrium polystomum]|nr:hypothetical protein DFJ73DRAFT_962571 [Zopfochytrium polystomum]
MPPSSSSPSPPSSPPSAIVVGAGPVGIAAAIALHDSTAFKNVALYDRVDAADASASVPFFGNTGGSISIYGNGLRCLDRLGVLDKVLAESSEGAPVMRFMLMDGSDAIIRNSVSNKAGELAPVQILRSTLHSVMLKHAVARGIPVHTSKKLVGVVELNDGVVARFDDGSEAKADILIGADGIQSATRKCVFPDHPQPKYLAAGHLGVFDRNRAVPADDKADAAGGKVGDPDHVVLNLDHPMGVYSNPLDGTLIYAVHCGPTTGAWMVMQFEKDGSSSSSSGDTAAARDDSWRPYTDLPRESTRLAETVAGWGAPRSVVSAVRHASRISPVAMYDLPDMAVLHRGRVVLLGDAAHGTLPTVGQGMSQGLEDALALAELLAEFTSPGGKSGGGVPDYATAFSLYDSVRLPRAHLLCKMAREVGVRMQASNAVAMRIGRFIFGTIVMIRNYLGLNDEVIAYDYRKDLAPAVAEYRQSVKSAAA